jgi:TonB-dependent Receptor Plug Domain.
VQILVWEFVVSVLSVAQLLFMSSMVCQWVPLSVTSLLMISRPSRFWRMLLLRVPSMVPVLRMVSLLSLPRMVRKTSLWRWTTPVTLVLTRFLAMYMM